MFPDRNKTKGEESPSPRGFVLVWAGLIGLTFLLYLPSFSFDWIMDDFPVVVDNLDIRSWANFLEDRYPGRPLRELTYLLDYRLFGLKPAGYHIQHLFWHALNGSLLFALARQLGCRLIPSALTALLFLAHPIQVEVVANISHRKDSLCLAFILLALIAYLKGRAGWSGRHGLWLVASAACWGVALLAKEIAIALPLVLLLYEISRVRNRKRRLAFLGGLYGMGAAGTLAWIVGSASRDSFRKETFNAFRKMGQSALPDAAGYYQTVAKGWAYSFWHLIWPDNLTMEFTFRLPTGWSDPMVIAGTGVGLLALGLLFLAVLRGDSPFTLGVIVAVGFWGVTSNLFGYLNYFVADRYWYTPFSGICLMVLAAGEALAWPAGAVTAADGRNRRTAMVMVCLAVLLLLGGVNRAQQAIWGDTELFYQTMLRSNPDSLEGLLGLGTQLLEEHRPAEALPYFQRALAAGYGDARICSNMGSALSKLGRDEEAVDFLKEAISRNPDNLTGYTNLGAVYEKLGNYDEAVKWHRMALNRDGKYGIGHYNLGVALYRLGRKDEALGSFARAVDLLPEDGDALYNYAVTALDLGRRDLARGLLPRLARLNPQQAELIQRELRP